MDNLLTILNALILGATGLVALVSIRATKRKTNAEAAQGEATAADQLTATALKLLEPLQESIAKLEAKVEAQAAELAQTKLDLAEALRQLAEMQKVEEYLRGRLHEKDKEIASLKKSHELDLKHKRQEIDGLRGRVLHLEEVCKRAGINGDDWNDDEEVT